MNAADYLDELRATHPDALRLAELACLAVRVEPHFLRALRQRFASDASPGVEIDLWHSSLASARGVDAFAFSPEVLQALRERLMNESKATQSDVLELTRACSAHHPLLARIELEVNALAVLEPNVADAQISQALQPALEQQRAGGEAAVGVARWLLHAAPRLHPRVLQVEATWVMLLQASAALGGRRLLEHAAPPMLAPETLAQMVPLPALPTRRVGVALVRGRLVFRSPLLAGPNIAVPALTPSLVIVRRAGASSSSWTVEATPGVSLDVGGATVVSLQTLAGTTFEIKVARQLRSGDGPLQARATRLTMCIGFNDLTRRLHYTIAERDAQGAVIDDLTSQVRAELDVKGLLRELVASASNDAAHDIQIRATLHHLVVPRPIDYLLGGVSETRLELDDGAASLPWELVDGVSGEARPWAIRAKLHRVRAVASTSGVPVMPNTSAAWRTLNASSVSGTSPQPNPSPTLPGDARDHVLVIGAPMTDTSLGELPGARLEARAVVAQLSSEPELLARENVHALINCEAAPAIASKLAGATYRIVHVVGHAAWSDTGEAGIALSGNATLGAAELRTLRVPPELVFVNGSRLARGASIPGFDRSAFAACFARELLDAGVRCVVVTGWIVEDEPALQFVGMFYQALLGGERFVDAVAIAREAAWRHSPTSNTWGAYQCSGDPDWRWRRAATDDMIDADSAEPMASPPALVEHLERLASRAVSHPDEQPRLARQALALELRYGALWGSMGRVAQAFGLGFGSVDDDERAVHWYRAATDARDGSGTFRAVEQLAQHLTFQALRLPDMRAAQRSLLAVVEQLQRLLNFQHTGEREYLLGSALKALAMVRAPLNRHEALKLAKDAYGHFDAASSAARTPRPAWAFDASRQQLAVELWMVFLDGRAQTADTDSVATLHRLLADLASTPTASSLERVEVRWLEAMTHGALASAAAVIADMLHALDSRAASLHRYARWRAEARFMLETYTSTHNKADAEAARMLLTTLAAITEVR